MSDDILHHLRESSLTTDPLVPVNGELEVPQGPGLGVELDRDALEHYTCTDSP
jgi:L-alanine-DL-glutamate epimerase-like enolase superfamily enzyme